MITKENEYTTPVICAAVEDSYDRLIAPAIEREIRNDLTERQRTELSMSSAKT